MTGDPLIAVDIGNSSTKVGWLFESTAAASLPRPQQTRVFPTGQSPPDEIANALSPGRFRWHIASVHREGTRVLMNWLASRRGGDEVRLLTHVDLPIVVRVAAPEQVGLDRLAVAVAANVLRSAGRSAIVIGAGSAITVNLVAADGAFEGGVILPGFRMSAEALYGADLLPLTVLAPNDDPPPLVGKSTSEAIRSGLFWGAVEAVRGIVDRVSAELDPRPEIFVTGGDLRRLTEHLGDEASFVPNLVLSGIAVAAARSQSPPGKKEHRLLGWTAPQ